MNYSILSFCLVVTFVAADITFIAVGDWGDGSTGGLLRQRNVATIMNQWCEERDCDFILSVGDSPIPGKTRSQKSRFTRAMRYLYGGSAIRGLRLYASLGGHIEEHNVQQLQYAVNQPQWYLPWYYYSFEMKDTDTSAVFYAMDTYSLRRSSRDPERQLSEMEMALQRDTDWKIVFGHHAPLSVGRTSGDETVLEQVVPLCEQYGVDAVIAGHDHNLQHIRGSHNPHVNFIVSGGGGRANTHYNQDHEQVINDLGYMSEFFDSTYGFVGITLGSQRMKVEFYDYKVTGNRVNKRLLHTFTKHK